MYTGSHLRAMKRQTQALSMSLYARNRDTRSDTTNRKLINNKHSIAYHRGIPYPSNWISQCVTSSGKFIYEHVVSAIVSYPSLALMLLSLSGFALSQYLMKRHLCVHVGNMNELTPAYTGGNDDISTSIDDIQSLNATMDSINIDMNNNNGVSSPRITISQECSVVTPFDSSM